MEEKNAEQESYIRVATPGDAEALLDIYTHYVLHTAISFEVTPPSVEEFRGRIERTLRRYPYLVAVEKGEIVGYAYTGAFVGRPAYDWAAETTIYLRADCEKHGWGRRLYRAIEELSREQNILNLYACIGYPPVEDEYLNQNSVQFHAHLGFRWVGEFYRCGGKFGRWYNMVWMEKLLGRHPAPPPAVIAFPQLPPQALAAAGVRKNGEA